MTIVGGTVSDAMGGKFANGAVTAAFSAAVSEGIRGVRLLVKGRVVSLSQTVVILKSREF